MTTPNPPSDCVGHCVGTASETTPRAQRDDCVGPAPLPYGGRHSQRAPLTASATTASTASDTHVNDHLIQAARVAQITGDAPGAMAVLQGCRRCHPKDGVR